VDGDQVARFDRWAGADLDVLDLGVPGAEIGNTDYLPSLSASVNQTVNSDRTKTTVVSSDKSSVSGEAVTFTATVAAMAPGAGVPTGTVTFSVTPPPGVAPVVSAPVELNPEGQATFALVGQAVGTYMITVSYGGDVDFQTSISRAFNQIVKQDDTTTDIVSSDNPSFSGEAVTFTATVAAAAPGSGTPTGSVTFYDGKTKLGTVQLTNGSATLTKSTLPVGTDEIKVVYSGDTNFKSSHGVLDQVVGQLAPDVATPIGDPGSPRNIADAGIVVGASIGQSDDPGVPIVLGVIDAAIEALGGDSREKAIPPHEASQAVPVEPVAIDASIA
jgi:Bacterial Ig-like domain (group 3)